MAVGTKTHCITAQKVPPKKYRPRVLPPKMYRPKAFYFLFLFSEDFFLLREARTHADHLPLHTTCGTWGPAMSTTEESASSTGGSSSGGDTASPPAPGSAGASQASQAAPLQPPRRAETTVDGGRGHKHVSVTLLEPTNVKKELTAWCWQFVSRFTPSINGKKNVVCLVKRDDHTPSNHLMAWAPSSSEGGEEPERGGNIWCTWRRRATPTWIASTCWVFVIGMVPTAYARRRASSHPRRKCPF